MSRSQEVLAATREAVRQSRARPWVQFSTQPTSGIRTRPAMPTSSTSTSSGTSQPAHRIRSQEAALQPRQVVPTPAPSVLYRLAARSVRKGVQAAKDRRAAAADPCTVQAKVVEACRTVRSRHVPSSSSASRSIQAGRPTLEARRSRQPSPAALPTKSLSPKCQSPSESSMTTGRSFSAVELPHFARCTEPPRPPTPQAPRAVKFHDIGVRAAPIPVSLNSTKALPKGILKRDEDNGLLTRKVVRFAEHFRQAKSAGGRVRGEVEWVKRVPKWIGVPEEPGEPRSDFVQHASVLEAQTKAEHVHPDPTRFLGRIQGWVGLDGQEEYLFGMDASSGAHAECRSPDCNKRRLHQWERKAILMKHGHMCLGSHGKVEHLPTGELIQQFNQRHGFDWSPATRTGPQYPKDRGL